LICYRYMAVGVILLLQKKKSHCLICSVWIEMFSVHLTYRIREVYYASLQLHMSTLIFCVWYIQDNPDNLLFPYYTDMHSLQSGCHWL